MNQQVEAYLQELKSQLRFLEPADRQDIIEEVESHIYERIEMGSSVEDVLTAFGSPRELARSYGGKVLSNSHQLSVKSLVTMIKFYFVTGVKGVIVIPFVAILSLTLYLCSFLVVIAAVIKGVGAALGYELPIELLNFGFFQVPTGLAVGLSIIIAGLMYVGSKKMWGFLKAYLVNISASYNKLTR